MIVDPGGKHERVIDLGCAEPCAADVSPSWTADGARIMFTRVIGPFDQPNGSARSAVQHTANLDGSDVQRLSEPGIDGVFEDTHSRFAPNGGYLTFVRYDNAGPKLAVFRMNADGSDVRQLTPWDLNAHLPDLSPATDGPTKDLVAFETFEDEAQDVATVPATRTSLADCASKITYVTDDGAGPNESFNPSWSPNGRRIAYVVLVPDDQTGHLSVDIWTVRPDGSGRRHVSTSNRVDYRPDWGVAGGRVTYR
jgi:Tol biopolymer transport system component